MSARWGIVGLGWLGSALAARLPESWGTHRGDFDFLRDPLPKRHCQTLFLNSPPLTELAPRDYAAKVAVTHAERIIFISSTSVYGNAHGELTEDSTPAPTTPGGQWLLQVEQELSRELSERLTVIRPGGLIGGERHPAKFLAGRGHIPGASTPVNLIHRDDLIEIILGHRGLPLINAVSPFHPPKGAYYTAWALKLGLPAPQFTEVGNETRVVRSKHLAGHRWKCEKLDWI